MNTVKLLYADQSFNRTGSQKKIFSDMLDPAVTGLDSESDCMMEPVRK